jgi:hypothetical protein
MTETPDQGQIYMEVVERAKRERVFSTTLSMNNVREIFSRQAKLDTSGDLPVLLPDFKAEITPGKTFHLYAPYTIDPDKKSLIIEGSARNNNQGTLTDETGITVIPDTLRARVIEAFEGKSDLPNFIKLIIEDAFQGEITVQKLWIDNDRLGITIGLGHM